MPLDVATFPSGMNPIVRFAGITCSALARGPMARHDETYFVPRHITPSGLEVKYTDRFDDPRYYSGDTTA